MSDIIYKDNLLVLDENTYPDKLVMKIIQNGIFVFILVVIINTDNHVQSKI